MPLGEGAVRRPGIDGTMDDSGFALQMGNLRTLRTLRTLSNLSVGLTEKVTSGQETPNPKP